MGYGLMVSLVPRADLRRVLGSGDETLVRDAAGPKCDDAVREALGRIVDGNAQQDDRARASAYGYASEKLCLALGERLDNHGFVPTSSDAIDAHESAVTAALGCANGEALVIRTARG